MTIVRFEVDDQEPLNRRLWQELVYLRAKLACEICGKRPYGDAVVVRPLGHNKGLHGTQLDAHHVNGDSADHRLANGQCLCNTCHVVITMTGRKRVMSPEWREKMRNLDRSAPHSDEARAKISAKAKARLAHPEARAALAERTRRNWQDPEFRAKAAAGMRKAWEKRRQADETKSTNHS